MKRLTKLANKYETDKGTEYDAAHSYTDLYESFFECYENPTILEIGVGSGGSAKMLNAFFDGQCTIYCIDNNWECENAVSGYDNIKFYLLDSSNEVDVTRFLNEDIPDVMFDIIIEDASHYWDHQMLNLYFFRKRLNKDGIFILEDLHSTYVANGLDVPAQNLFACGNGYDKSPLYFLNFFEGAFGLDDERRKELASEIDDVLIYNRYNEKNKDFWYRSVTSIITFK